MNQIRFHGRGGQGAVTAAEILAVAAFKDGKSSQAFPAFGVERRGAPVQAFARISDEFIRIRSQIYEPDYVVVLDPTLIEIAGVTNGLVEKGKLIINSEKTCTIGNVDTYCVNATQIAIDTLGIPIVNTAMLGAFAGATREVSFESLSEAITERFGERLGLKNCKAAKVAYDAVRKS